MESIGILIIAHIIVLGLFVAIGALSDIIRSTYQRYWLGDTHDYWKVWRDMYNWPDPNKKVDKKL
jgi:hypothetical protein